ncbi:hypothetical protein AAVH_13767 [Aphelenchoides avenae]|nr:hypothetical protein AAVH_13767 [Aphelenchus avenae]
MGNRLHKSQAPASASEDLVKRLKAAGNDTVLLHEIIESNDSASVAAAFAALLAGGTSSTANKSELRKKTFLEVVLFADRDTLDAMQLVCSFLLKFIRERELTQLTLRPISRVNIGEYILEISGGGYDGWLPTVKMEYSRGAGKEVAPKTVHQLTCCLHMAFCESQRLVFDDLVAPSTFVGTLDVRLPRFEVELANRGIVAFKSVKRVNLGSPKGSTYGKLLDEAFFVPAAQRGVRHLKHCEYKMPDVTNIRANTTAALAFGFAEPTAGGDRSLRGIHCDVGADLLTHVKQKADMSLRIDSTGFEKYQRGDGRTWLMEDLYNLVNVEVKQTMHEIEIHVFSSV